MRSIQVRGQPGHQQLLNAHFPFIGLFLRILIPYLAPLLFWSSRWSRWDGAQTTDALTVPLCLAAACESWNIISSNVIMICLNLTKHVRTHACTHLPSLRTILIAWRQPAHKWWVTMVGHGLQFVVQSDLIGIGVANIHPPTPHPYPLGLSRTRGELINRCTNNAIVPGSATHLPTVIRVRCFCHSKPG